MSNYQSRPRLPSPKIFDIGEISCYLSGEDIDNLIEAGIAVVIHGNGPTHPYADNVMIDEVKAAEEAISYLIDKGHRRIGTIVGPEATWDGRLRKEGYLNSLQAHGFPVDDELICEVDFFRHEAGALGMKKFLPLSEPPSAVFAGSDHLAVDALLFALDSGLSVPEDVAIIGFDNTPTATRIRPRLTTIHKDVNVLGSTAVQLLVERINSEGPLPARQKMIGHRLVFRESA